MRPHALLRDLCSAAQDAWRSKAVLSAALLILPYAGVLIGLDVARHYGAITEAPLPVQFSLASDGGFGEWLEYSLTLSIAVMLFLLWRTNRCEAYLVNALLFIWLTLDNSIEIHERFGQQLGPVLADLSPSNLEPNHLGEAILFGAIGLIWLAGLARTVTRGQLRQVSHMLLLSAIIAGTAVFGVGVDLIVSWGEHSAIGLEIITFVEDGGEFGMICLAFFLTVAIYDLEREQTLDASAGLPREDSGVPS
jgi:hypothetical protein